MVTGGARSGKSAFAQRLASFLGEPVVYVATARPLDDEMRERIAAHRSSRPPGWITVEEYEDVAKVIAVYGHQAPAIIVDCLAILVSNLMGQEAVPAVSPGDDGNSGGWDLAVQTPSSLEQRVVTRVEELVATASKVPAHVIVVSNEVGFGIVPANRIARVYRDLLGRANQLVASCADEVYLMVSGIPLELKSLRPPDRR